MPAAGPRTVSLIASSTEIVCALELGELLVGRSHECDHPSWVTRLPVLTAPKFEVEGSSREIDERVKTLLRDALAVYRVDVAGLQAVRPEVILTQSQCQVCAVSLEDVEQAVGALVDSRPRIVSLEPDALEDVFADVGRVAEALGEPERGRALVRRMRERMEAVAARAGGAGPPPTVAVVEWIDPLMAAGNWTPELVALGGGRNLFGEAGRHAPWLTWEALAAADPQVILVVPCGFDLARTRREMPALTERPGWGDLRAVRAGRVALADGNQFFNRPGPRLCESLEILAEILHPQAFSSGHRGSGWEPL